MLSDYKKPEPRTQAQARRLFSNDAIKKLVKSEVQRYIESFFEKAGNNFDLLRIVSPSSVKYNTDRSFDPATDPTQRRLQIARYFNELRAILPSILIMDGGIVPNPQGIGLIGSTAMQNGQWVGSYPITKFVPITILFASRDMESADEMSGVASLLFNELRNVAGGSYISGRQEDGESWVIYLPNEGVPVSALLDIEVEGDPVEKIYYSEVSMNVFFEDVVSIKQNMYTIESRKPVVNESDLASSSKPEIVIGESLSIESPHILLVRGINNSHQIRISDPNVATLTHTMVLNPRRYGSTDIIVIDTRRPADDQVVARKTIKIV